MGKIIRNGIVYAGSPNVEVIDAYTKTESNSRFASKSIYGDRAIQLNRYSYSVSIGGNNREDYPFIGNVMIGIDNRIFGATYNNCIIGHNNEISKSVTSGDKNIVIGNYIDYQGEYGVAIGYDDKFMEVCPNGDVIVRGDVQCSDGSSGTISMRALNNNLANILVPQEVNITMASGATKKTGYVYKIGKLVVVNIRVSVLIANQSIKICSGLPGYLGNNSVGCCVGNIMDDAPANTYGYINRLGDIYINIPNTAKDYFVSATYICN